MTCLGLLLLALLSTPALSDDLESVLRRPVLGEARVGLAVVDTETGATLVARRADEALIPASNMKLLTTAAAVLRLRPGFLFTTRILSEEPPDDQGVVNGDLVLWGSGDPCLREDALSQQGVGDPAFRLVELLDRAGVRRVEGALVLDDGFLDREWVHPDWDTRDLVYEYAAPVGALSMRGNTLGIEVDARPGSGHDGPRAQLRPAVPGYRLQNELKWADGRTTNQVSLGRPDDDGVVLVRGKVSRGIGPRTYTVSVRDGPLLFGRALRAELDRRDIDLRRGVVREAGAARSLAAPHELVRFETPLELAVVLANKESDNSISDHLFKVLGAVVEDDGSFAGGGAALTKILTEQVGTDTSLAVFQDGSGLARTNRVTARIMVDTLVTMAQADEPARDLFLRTLPVSGMDGTLRERLQDDPYRGAVRAKTGYIRGVSALSGYARTRQGRVLAFSILINDVPHHVGNAAMKAIQDDICRDLVDRW